MSLASRITDAIDAIATAFNARNAPGASDYQVWLAQGNTGTIDNYRASVLGADMDLAARFTSALGPVPTVKTASEAQAGITQFATRAETQAATSAVKAVSPAQLANYVQYASGVRVNGISGLLALVQSAFCPPYGTIVHANYDNTFGIEHYASVWRIVGGNKAEPLNGVPILLANQQAVTNLGYNYSDAGGALWNRYFNFDPGNTVCNIPRVNGTAQQKDTFAWIGNTTRFLLWDGYVGFTPATNVSVRGQNGVAVRVRGEWVDLHVALSTSAQIAQFGLAGTFDAAVRPPYDEFLHGAANNWNAVEYYVTSAGELRPLTAALAAGSAFHAEGSLYRVIPSS